MVADGFGFAASKSDGFGKNQMDFSQFSATQKSHVTFSAGIRNDWTRSAMHDIATADVNDVFNDGPNCSLATHISVRL